jgi:hypothetical protein
MNLNKILNRKKSYYSSGKIKVYFDNLDDHFISHLKKAKFAVGCVAWVSSRKIMIEMKKLKAFSLVVNTEKHLTEHCDILSHQTYLKTLLIGPVLKIGAKSYPSAVCCGEFNQTDNPQEPLARMHHKFVVMLDAKKRPIGVWTGSFNFTSNAQTSLENAVYISDPKIAKAYFQEWKRVFKISQNIVFP